MRTVWCRGGPDRAFPSGSNAQAGTRTVQGDARARLREPQGRGGSLGLCEVTSEGLELATKIPPELTDGPSAAERQQHAHEQLEILEERLVTDIWCISGEVPGQVIESRGSAQAMRGEVQPGGRVLPGKGGRE